MKASMGELDLHEVHPVPATSCACLPAGRRRNTLRGGVERLFAEEFHGRILPFTVESARVYPALVYARQRMGRPISQFDAVIASICRSRDASIATRNVADFDRCGLDVINPWSAVD